MAVIAADLGGTKLATALFGMSGNPEHQSAVPLAGRTGQAVGDLVVSECGRLLRIANGLGRPVNAIGVAVPGIFRAGRGTVWAPNISGWDDYSLRQELSDGTGGTIPIRIESDRSCCILGEVWHGAAKGCKNAVFITVGTGIGTGIIADGRVLRGARDIAGSIGWLALCRPFDPKYSPVGCFEYYGSGDGIARLAKERIGADPGYSGTLSKTDVGSRNVFQAYESGDPIARSVLEDCISLWGMAAANLVSILNPEVIVFGGGVFGPAARFLDHIRDEAARWAQPIAFQQARFAISSLGGEAALYGAAYAAMQREDS